MGNIYSNNSDCEAVQGDAGLHGNNKAVAKEPREKSRTKGSKDHRDVVVSELESIEGYVLMQEVELISTLFPDIAEILASDKDG